MSTATLEAPIETSITLAPKPEKAEPLYPPLLCEACDAVLVEAMPEEGRDELIEALTGEEIFHTTHQRVCLRCYVNDDSESPYIKADYHQ